MFRVLTDPVSRREMMRLGGLPPLDDVSAERLRGREALLRDLDGALGRLADDPGVRRMNAFYRQAVTLISSRGAR